MAVASITDTEPQQEQQERQKMNTINVTIQEQYNSTTQTTNHEETKVETTKPDAKVETSKPDANLKQILDYMKFLSEKVDKIENQNLNQQLVSLDTNYSSGYIETKNLLSLWLSGCS